MENINLKAALLAVVLIIFTYNYYVKEPGSILSFGTLIVVGILALIIFFAYFFGIKIIGYVISNKIFPNVLLNILIPFLVISFTAWVIYAFMYIKPFGLTKDFLLLVKVFAAKHLVFIAICSTVIGLTLSFPAQTNRPTDQLLLRNNLLFISCGVLIFLLGIFAFYRANLINQPPLDPKYTAYKYLGESMTSKNYEVTRLVAAAEQTVVDQPYLLADKNELILFTLFQSGNTPAPIATIYRIDQDGKLVASAKSDEFTDNHFFPVVLKDGMLTDYDGDEEITWIFDGNKKRLNAASIVRPAHWKLKQLEENTDSLHMVYFNKTALVKDTHTEKESYTGTQYYEVVLPKDQLKIKTDEKKLSYYTSPHLNFGLLCLNEREYYIIRMKSE